MRGSSTAPALARRCRAADPMPGVKRYAWYRRQGVVASVPLVVCTSWVEGAPFAYVITGNGVSVIDTTTNVVTATVPLAEPAYGVTVNRAGSRVVFG